MKKISFVLRLVFWYLFMSKVFSNDFWDHAMKTHYDQRVSLFNTMKIKDGSVIMLGNSITASCNWSELFGVDNVINRGIGGDTTEGILGRIEFLKTCNPDAVFLLIGTNDLSKGKTPDEILINYKKIVSRIRKYNPELDLFIQSVLPINEKYFLLPPKYDNKKIKLLNRMIKKLEGDKVTYINLFDNFLDSSGNLKSEYSNDGLHLSGTGYQRWKNILIESCDKFK